mgnify:CR=1 FL=1
MATQILSKNGKPMHKFVKHELVSRGYTLKAAKQKEKRTKKYSCIYSDLVHALKCLKTNKHSYSNCIRKADKFKTAKYRTWEYKGNRVSSDTK